MIDTLVFFLWFVAFVVWTHAVCNYLAGVHEFKDWKWPWR